MNYDGRRFVGVAFIFSSGLDFPTPASGARELLLRGSFVLLTRLGGTEAMFYEA